MLLNCENIILGVTDRKKVLIALINHLFLLPKCIFLPQNVKTGVQILLVQ